MKNFLLVFALSLSPALAQFGWDEEPEQTAATDSFDAFDTARPTPVIEPIEPVNDPVTAIFQPFVSPVVDVDPLVEQCDLEPEVAEVYRASGIDDSTRDPLPATSYGRDAACPTYLGRLSANPYASDSTANPYSSAGSPYSAKSVNNPFGPYGSPYSSTSARNPYATDAPKIVAQDGTYLVQLVVRKS
jgi:hypothetical protein